MAEVSEGQSPFLQEGKSSEKHPFQDLLYGLRDEGLRVSTDEWLDLQKVLEKGKIENLDEMYFVSRSVLVKDISDYASFDTVFGKLFFGIEPPTEDQEDEDEFEEREAEPEKDETTAEEAKEVEQKEQENIEEVEEASSKDSEETHGGNEATKDIKNSPNAANQGMQKNPGAEEGKSPENKGQKGEGGGQKQKNAEGGGKQEKEGEGGGNINVEAEGGGSKNETGQGGEGEKNKKAGGGINKDKIGEESFKHGKGGQSAKEIISERRHEVFDKDRILNYEQFGRVLAKLVTIIQDSTEEPSQKLDVERTVSQVAKNAGAPELVWREEIEEKPKVLLFFDVGGTTDPYKPIMEKLFAAAVDYLENVDVYYFHNAIYGEVWPQKDGNYGTNFISMEKILKNDPNTKVLIIGDAWMGESDWMNGGLHDSYDQLRETRKGGYYSDTAYENFKAMRSRLNNIVWVNPIPERERDEMDNSGTIADLEKVFSTHELTLRGIEKATQELMES
jgi:uncharacterized protein with von Willebrand factor type A (vWA) domain